MKIRIYSLLLCGFALGSLSALAQQSPLLEKYRTMALDYNHDLKAAEKNIAASMEVEKSARADLKPKLSGTANFQYTENPLELTLDVPSLGLSRTVEGKQLNYGGSLSILQPVYTGGRVLESIRMAQHQQSFAANQAKALNDAVCYQTDIQYWSAVARQEIVTVAEDFRNSIAALVKTIKERVEVGLVISLIENGEVFIKRNCKMKWRKTANSREEMPEYVEQSYHEALVNALAHRDYLVNGSEVHIDIYDDRMEIYSPGGMPDGSMIQDRDPLTVPSTRRNPVLADVFNRLGYMERKGSGFGKIISGYEFQINYSEGKRPTFRSDRYQFTVVMPNLNYNVPQDVPQDKLDMQILDLIRKDNKISTEKMAIALGVSSKTIKRHIKEMDNICYVGRGFSGHWKITDKE